MRISFISLAAASAVALGGCTYGDVGLGYGYGGYGYNDYGYYNPYYYGGYGYPYGGFGYGTPYYGWYGDSYYPGTGVYVYDSYRRPRTWTSRERSYWTSRQPTTTTTTTRTSVTRPNWSGFDRHSQQVKTTDRHRSRP
jgi:hypothetical protein